MNTALAGRGEMAEGGVADIAAQMEETISERVQAT